MALAVSYLFLHFPLCKSIFHRKGKKEERKRNNKFLNLPPFSTNHKHINDFFFPVRTATFNEDICQKGNYYIFTNKIHLFELFPYDNLKYSRNFCHIRNSVIKGGKRYNYATCQSQTHHFLLNRSKEFHLLCHLHFWCLKYTFILFFYE